VGDIRLSRFDMMLSIYMVYRYDIIPYDTAPLPQTNKKFNKSLHNAKTQKLFV